MGFGDSTIPTYMALSVFSFIFNPLFGIISIACSKKVSSVRGNRKREILYSDLAFGFGYMAIVSTVVIIVLVYAFGMFPDHTYYCREDIIAGVTSNKTCIPFRD